MLEWERNIGDAVPRMMMGSRLQRAADELADDYDLLIDQLARRYNSLGWWIGKIGEKNPYCSLLFFHVCYLQIVIEIIEVHADACCLVIAESAAFRKQLELFANNADWSVQVVGGWQQKLRRFRHSLALVIYGFYHKLHLTSQWLRIKRWSRHLFAYGDLSQASSDSKQGVVLIHSWLRHDSLDERGRFVDRFFWCVAQ